MINRDIQFIVMFYFLLKSGFNTEYVFNIKKTIVYSSALSRI